MGDRTFLALMVAISLAVKIPIALFLLNGFGVDESLYIATSRNYVETGTFGVHTEFNDFRFIAPLLSVVMSGFYEMFGSAGQLMVSPIMGSLAIIPFFYIGKLLLDRKSARSVAILTLVNPAFFLLSTRPLTESLGILLFATSLLLFIMAMRDRKYWALVVPSAVLTFLTRYPYGLILLVFFFAFLVLDKKLRLLTNRSLILGVVLGLVVLAPWMLYNYQELGNVFGGPVHQGSTDVGFNYQTASWYVPYLFIISGATFPFMLYGVLKGIRDRKSKFALIGFFVVFLVQFFVFGKLVEERYILPILPFASVLTVLGYTSLLKLNKNLTKYVFVGLVVVNIAAAAYLTNMFDNLPKYVDTQQAVNWMKDNCGQVIFGNVFTPVYNAMGVDVIRPTLNQDEDNITIRERSVDCVIVSRHEAPYSDFFRNDFGAESMGFGGVSVYKIL